MQKSTPKAPKPHLQERRKARWGYFFCLPWLVLFLIFYVYPFFYGIVVSFTDFKIGSMSWNGISNYKEIAGNYAFWRSLLATLCYAAICIPLEVFIPLWAANTLRPHSNRFNTVSKLLIYLPGVVSSVALVIAWKVMLLPDVGIISQLLKPFGLGRVSLLDSAITSIPVMSVLIVACCLGANLIIYSGALNNIPATYFEAAELDGATRGQQFRKITMPLLQPTMVYVFITSTIACLQIFVIPQLMTSGGPNYTTSSLLMLIYSSAFSNGKFGYASAIGVILFAITAVIAVIQFRVTQRETIEY